MCKYLFYIYIYIYICAFVCVCVCIKVKKGAFKVFINLKTNEKPMVNN